jgi:vacuolar-type H+-ATPase subunit E/Vma4
MQVIGDKNKLIEEILSDATRKKEQMLKKASLEADKIIKKAEKDAMEAYNKALLSGKEKAEEERKRILSSVPQDIKKKEIESISLIVNKTLESFDDYIKSIDKKELREVELWLLKSCTESLEPGEYTVYTNPESTITQEDIKQKATSLSLKLSFKHDKNVDFGVTVKSADNRLELNNTISGKISREKEDIRYNAYKILFS